MWICGVDLILHDHLLPTSFTCYILLKTENPDNHKIVEWNVVQETSIEAQSWEKTSWEDYGIQNINLVSMFS